MPPARPKPSEIAAEAKKIYIPYIEQRMPECPVRSWLHEDCSEPLEDIDGQCKSRLRVAVIEGDPIDVALSWYSFEYGRKSDSPGSPASDAHSRIPVINMANEKRAGGDWESGLIAPEECFARRSNLVHTLTTPSSPNRPSYPLPQRGGIYSPHVVYRDGPEQYEIWRDFLSLPVISVAPVRRPKLDESGTQYSFDQERELMMDKMRTILRIASMWQHRNLCMGAFGVGPIFRNPVGEIARMWKTLLFHEEEFAGRFSSVVFAIENTPGTQSKASPSDLEIFQREFDPSNIFKTSFR